MAKLVALDTEDGDMFGSSVAVRGTTIVVGASKDVTATENDTGSAYVFERDVDGFWIEMAKLLGSNAGSNDEVGTAASICGERIVVSSPYDDDAGTNGGSAYLYERDADGLWIQLEVEELYPFGVDNHPRFGLSASCDGATIAVGGPYYNGVGYNSGVVFVFQR